MTTKRKTREQFIIEAVSVHGNLYDYSKVVYKNNITKVCIICPIHGEFWQTPKQHLRGQGCPLCGKKKTRGKSGKFDNSKRELWKTIRKDYQISEETSPQAFNTEIVVEFLKEKYGDAYDYSKVNYVRMRDKITLICPKHGEFEKTASALLHDTTGCPICIKERKRELFALGKDVFIERAHKLYNGFYNYDRVNYYNNSTNVEIICPKHGVFVCTPGNHLKGRGCPICKSETFVYEQRLYNFLLMIFEETDIIRQYKPLWLTGNKSIDFYIEKYRIAIEHQGSQHFKKVKYFSTTDEKLQKTIYNDKKKILECEENGVHLLHFSYELTKVPNNCEYELFLDEDILRKKIYDLINNKIENE